MKEVFLVLVILLSTGCNLLWRQMTPEEKSAHEAQQASEAAENARREATARIDASNIPMCTKVENCQRMWAAARAWVAKNIAWKIQTMSDGFLETYNPAEHSRSPSARVVQEPTDNGGYRFVVSFGCRNMFGCLPGELAATADFNNAVRAVVK